MRPMIAEFAGVDRAFALRLGDLFDVEAACDVSIGVLYRRFATTSYATRDILHVLRFGLTGGGMDAVDAERLVKEQIGLKPLAVLATIAADLILHVMTGPDVTGDGDADGKASDIHKKFDVGAILLSLVKVGLSPDQIRAMSYSDFCAIVRASQADGDKINPPSEEQYFAQVAAWEARLKLEQEKADVP